jgi:hypothetical protein
MTLDEMMNIDLQTIEPNSVVDARDINIDIQLPVNERVISFQKQAGNPYLMKVGTVIVKSVFSNTSDSINDRIENYLKTS